MSKEETKYIEEKLKQEFIKDFGYEAWKSLDLATQEHKGSDYRGNFMQVILTVIGYSCIENEEYRRYHGIPITWEQFKNWLIKHKEEMKKINVDEKDIDFLAFWSGAYSFLE